MLSLYDKLQEVMFGKVYAGGTFVNFYVTVLTNIGYRIRLNTLATSPAPRCRLAYELVDHFHSRLITLPLRVSLGSIIYLVTSLRWCSSRSCVVIMAPQQGCITKAALPHCARCDASPHPLMTVTSASIPVGHTVTANTVSQEYIM